MRIPLRFLNCAALAILLPPCSPSSRGDQFFSTRVISTVVGESQHPYFNDPVLSLGGPLGEGTFDGSMDVYNLGIGGSLTLGFDSGPSSDIPRVICDRPGPDFIVFENPIYAGSNPPRTFAELMYVEVSSNGVDFARFPVMSNTPQPVSAYGTIQPADVSGFGGVHAVMANVDPSRFVNPFDPAVAGGDAFDLADLSGHPLVSSGKLNLAAIRHVRLIDVIGDGRDLDGNNHPIYDATGEGTNGADVDAVAVINGGLLAVSARLIGSAGGNFNDPSRWDVGVVPTGAGAVADISPLGSGSTLSLSQNVSLSQLQMGSNSNRLAGPSMLTLDGSVGSAELFATSGLHTISAPVEFSGDVVLSAGYGTILFTGPLTYDDNASITVLSGTIAFALDQGPVIVGENVTFTVTGGSTLALGGRINPLQDSVTGQFMSMSYTAVPEPGTLLGMGLAGCVLLRRKRCVNNAHEQA